MSSTKKIALFGDSYIKRLGAFCNFNLKVPGNVKFFGKGGMKAESYDERLFQELVRFKPDLTIVLLGGNDITSVSRPSDIFRHLKLLTERLAAIGCHTICFIQITERGKFRDAQLSKKSFNAQRKRINNLMSGIVETVTIKDLRFPKDYDKDFVHVNNYGQSKLFFTIRRKVFSLK